MVVRMASNVSGLPRLVVIGLCLAILVSAGPSMAFVPRKVGFWTFLATRDHVVIIEIVSARALREGQKRCGIHHTAVVIRAIKGQSLGEEIEFVSAGDAGVGTRSVLLLSRAENERRKRDVFRETSCAVDENQWYLGRFASDHILPVDEYLSGVFQTDVVEIASNRFLPDPLFIQDDVQLENGKIPMSMGDYRREYSSSKGEGYFVTLAAIEAAVREVVAAESPVCTSPVFPRHLGSRDDARAFVGSGLLTSSIGTISGLSLTPKAP